MRILLLLSLLTSVNFIFAQQKDSSTTLPITDKEEIANIIKKKRNRAEIHYQNEDYAMALSNLKELVLLIPDSADVHYKLGLCYFKSNNDSLALLEFEKAYTLGEKKLPEIHYYLAVTKQLNGLFDDATTHFSKEKEKAILKLEQEYLKTIEKHITECISGKDLQSKKDTTIQLYTIGDSINSPFQESSLYFSPDTILYITSTKPTKTGVVSENIYYSKKTGNKWSKVTDIGKPINTLGNDAIVGLADAGNKLFLYADVNGGDIYYSVKKENAWSRPLFFSDSINSPKMETSICFSADSSTIYFVSNRLGTIGGTDIFYSVKKDNSWSSPLNMGSIINSEYDEESPFFIKDTLYFSSKGHNSIGGFDVFKSYKQNGTWVKPVNLGFPINSPYDELSFTVFNNLKYIITDRPGSKGETDIYEIDLIENRREKKSVPVEELLVIADSSESAISDLKDSSAVIDKSAQETLAQNNNASASTKDSGKEIQDKLNALQTGESIDLVGLLSLNPILFKFDKFSLTPDAKKTLDSIIHCLKQHPDLKMEIRVYTDCRGRATYNKKLSEKRALAIKEYIRKKSSSVSKRTKLFSLGEKNLLIDCNCDGRAKNKCSVTEHMQNRRAEVKVLRK